MRLKVSRIFFACLALIGLPSQAARDFRGWEHHYPGIAPQHLADEDFILWIGSNMGLILYAKADGRITPLAWSDM
jgi:hypothetical protein